MFFPGSVPEPGKIPLAIFENLLYTVSVNAGMMEW